MSRIITRLCCRQCTPIPRRAAPVLHAYCQHLLSTVLETCAIDLATREVTLSIRLPSVLLDPLPVAEADEGRVSFRSLWSSVPDATANTGPRIAEGTCEHEARTKCYRCRRLGRAA